MSKPRGKFITLEGGEGVGKSSNLPFIQAYLVQQGISVVQTREPGGTVLAEKLRTLLLDASSETLAEQTEVLLMFAARAQHIKHVIEPALAKGQWVLCDRFTDSTYAYQSGGRAMPVATIAQLETMVQGTLRPDLTLLLDAPVIVGMQRAKKRAAFDRFEAEQLAFFERVRAAYLQQAQRHPERITIIAADQALVEVQQAIITALQVLCR